MIMKERKENKWKRRTMCIDLQRLTVIELGEKGRKQVQNSNTDKL